jgi:hydrogenase maturation protease
VVVVDTVRVDERPGTIRRYRREELLAAPPLPRTSPHEPGLREALLAVELTDTAPAEILLVGVVPGSTEVGTRLTPAVEAAIEEAVAAVVAELERLDTAPRRREEDLPLDVWWSGAADEVRT